MCLCYNQDTTTNKSGADSGVTAEGSQNEGKYWYCEKPAVANLKFFAGVVAGAYAGVGPRVVDLYEPNGAVVPVRGNSSFTIGDKVYLQAAGYAVKTVPSANGFVGYAMETIDRSVTAGLVLVKLLPSGLKADDSLTAAGDGYSPLIWDQIPVEDIQKDPNLGIVYENDFLNAENLATGEGWTITQVTSGTLSLSASEEGGALVFDSAGNASADDGVQAQLLNCRVLPKAGRKIAFEARVKMNDATDQYFLGLCATDTTIIASGVIDDASDKCGFFHHAASTDNKISAVSARTTSEEIDADVANNVDATYVKLGFVIDGLTSVTWYVNGVAVGTVVDANDIPNAAMCLSGVAQIEGTGADAEMTVDWVRVAQYGDRT